MTLENLFTAVESGAVVLTANNRVARSLRHAYAVRQRETGLGAWRSPEILAWGAWVVRCWEDALYAGRRAPLVLLSAEQEGAAWERAIGEDPEGHPLLQVAATARQAAAAWELAHAWRLDFEAEEWDGNEDAQAFLRWAAAFRERCDREGWLDSARLLGEVATAFREGGLRAPNRVLLIGFDEFTPQQKELWAVLRRAGCQVQQADGSAGGGKVRAVLADLAGTEEEIRTAARWARRLLEQGSPRIGVIVPDLARVRPVVDRIFREVMYPGEMAVDPRRSCYNISFGVPLVDYPLVSTALRILEMPVEAAPVETVGRLLRSPFVKGWGAEWTARALLDARVAALGDIETDLRSLVELARQEKGWHCPRFANGLEAWRERRRGLPDRWRPSRWAAVIPELLGAMGWPGDRTLDSVEYQTTERWRQLLAGLAGLDGVLGAVSLGQAVGRLRARAAETQFQPLQQDAPVQVLGVFEASGMRFEDLWVMGMHDEAWPEPPSPNPFLPVALQRRYELPHASAERELGFARRVTERLLESAARVVVSWPRREGDRDLRPSPLVAHLPQVMAELLEMAPAETFAVKVRGAAATESLPDETGPAVGGETWSRGGAKVFQYQAACPFRAFAELRLGAGPLEHPEPGLDPRLRGTLLHMAMERLWRALGSQARLHEMGEGEVRAVVRESVAGAIAEKCGRRRLASQLRELEQARLEALLLDWLEIEKERQAFRVLVTEEKREVELGGVKVRVKIDRVDELEDGRRVILDYKSGDPDERAWEGERPDEPQVPLYALIEEGELAAAAFAKVRSAGSSFRGIAAGEGILPKVKSAQQPVAEQVTEWRRVLTRLAEEFRAGRAVVDPKNGMKTCQTCDLTALCRVREVGEDGRWE